MSGERAIVEIVAPDGPGGLVVVPELVARQVRGVIGEEGALHRPCVPALLLRLLVTEGDLVQPVVPTAEQVEEAIRKLA